MAKKNVSKKLITTTEKIVDVADLLLIGADQNDWEVDEIHLTPKKEGITEKVVCKYEKVDGKWVLICKST